MTLAGFRQVNLIAEQDGTSFHCLDDWSLEELGLSVDQSESADEVVLVSLHCEVDADDLPLGRSTCLLDHISLAVAGESSDEDWVEHRGLDDILDRLEVAEGDKEVVLLGHQMLCEPISLR